MAYKMLAKYQLVKVCGGKIMERLQLVGGFHHNTERVLPRVSGFNPIATSERLELLECLMAQEKRKRP